MVIPVFDERESLPRLFARLGAVLDAAVLAAPAEQWEVVLVDDGSTDGSSAVMARLPRLDGRFRVVHLSRNFGQQAAIICGLRASRGATVTVLDADLQDPPEELPRLIAAWREGFDVVYAVRRTRRGDGAAKVFAARAFYKVLRLLGLGVPLDAGEFRLMDRAVVDALCGLRERRPFVRGLVHWLGFRSTEILYDRAAREAGETHFGFLRMAALALDGIMAFSKAPVRGLFPACGVLLALATTLGLFEIFAEPNLRRAIWVAATFTSGMTLLGAAIVGEFVVRLFDEVRERPRYVISTADSFDEGRAPNRGAPPANVDGEAGSRRPLRARAPL